MNPIRISLGSVRDRARLRVGLQRLSRLLARRPDQSTVLMYETLLKRLTASYSHVIVVRSTSCCSGSWRWEVDGRPVSVIRPPPPATHLQPTKHVAPQRTASRGNQIGKSSLVWLSTGAICLNVWRLLFSRMLQNVQHHHPCMAVADMFSSLSALGTSLRWMPLLLARLMYERFRRLPGGFALPADLERAMALDHIGGTKRFCKYGLHTRGFGFDPVRHGLALGPKMKLPPQRFEGVFLRIDSVK